MSFECFCFSISIVVHLDSFNLSCFFLLCFENEIDPVVFFFVCLLVDWSRLMVFLYDSYVCLNMMRTKWRNKWIDHSTNCQLLLFFRANSNRRGLLLLSLAAHIILLSMSVQISCTKNKRLHCNLTRRCRKLSQLEIAHLKCFASAGGLAKLRIMTHNMEFFARWLSPSINCSSSLCVRIGSSSFSNVRYFSTWAEHHFFFSLFSLMITVKLENKYFFFHG